MNNRIKEIRKALNLHQKDFGAKIGLKSNSISDIENGKCIVTERTILNVCSQFNVNENWLRTGEGEMFNINNKNYDEFFNYFSHLAEPLQDFLIKVAKDLLDTQEKL